MSTLFTRIIDGELPGRFCWSDDECVAFASINPIMAGHQLVVPRAEVARFTDLSEKLAQHLMVVTQRIGRAQQLAWDAPRAVVAIAGFEVPHTHIHVLPAWGDAQLTFANARADVPSDELDAATQRVRVALRELGYGNNVPPQLTSPTL